jgi:tetratricopeptide (TPR) repeat protein
MSGDQETFSKAMNAGHSAAWDQMWDRAAVYYQQALELSPDNPLALSSLGLAYYEMQEWDQSLNCYLRAARVAPNEPVYFDKIARINERLGRLNDAVQAALQAAELYLRSRDAEKATENLTRAISIQPDQLTPRTRLAMIFERMGRKTEAVAEYLAVASLMQERGEVQKTRQVVDYALQIMPENTEAQQAAAMLRSNQPLRKPSRPRGGTGPVRMAEVRQLEPPKESEEKTPDPITEARQIALVQLAALLFDQAEGTQAASIRGRNDTSRAGGLLPDGLAERTQILMHLGQAIDSQTQGAESQAVEELEKAASIGLKHPAALFDLGLLQMGRDAQKAFRYLQQSVQHPDFALASQLLMGKAYRESGDLKEAANSYLHALRLADMAAVSEQEAEELGQLYDPVFEAQSGQPEQKLEELCDSIQMQLQRDNWRSYLQDARQQLQPQTSEEEALLPLAEMLLETRSTQVVEALAKIQRYVADGKINSAMEEAFRVLQYSPTYLPLHARIGDLLMQEGHIQMAVEKYSLVSELHVLRGETSQAIRLLGHVTQMIPMDVGIRSRLIELLTAQGRMDEAVQEQIKLGDIYNQLADLDMARKTYLAAFRSAQQSRNTRALSAATLNKIADIDLQRLDWRQALRVFEQIRTLEPEDITARVRLVDLNYRLGQDTAAVQEADHFISLMESAGKRSSAVTFMLTLLDECPDKLELRKKLADLYLRDGQKQKAVDQLDKIANSLLEVGNKSAAIMMVQSIIALNPPNLFEYQRVLEQLKSGG